MKTVKADINAVKKDINAVKEDVNTVKDKVDELSEQTLKTNDKVETYQKASQQVVNLAFGLIVAAALAIILPVISQR